MSHHRWWSGVWKHFPTRLAKGDPLPPHPEEDVDADVDQQGDDKGQVEGNHRGVDDKVGVGDGAHHGVICEFVQDNVMMRTSVSTHHLPLSAPWGAELSATLLSSSPAQKHGLISPLQVHLQNKSVQDCFLSLILSVLQNFNLFLKACVCL